MKKWLIVLIVVLVLCLFSCMLSYIIFQGGPVKLFKRLFQKDSIIVLIERGFVYYKEDKEGEYKVAKDEEELYPDYWVKTDRGAEAHLIFEDNTMISLDEETEIQVVDVATKEGETTVLKQFLGSSWHRINKLTGKSYEVETPNAIAAVRGTIFGVRAGEVSEIFSIEHTIDAIRKDDKGKKAGESEIPEGKYSLLSLNDLQDNIFVGDIPETLKATRWFRHNQELDAYYKEAMEKGLDNRRDFIKKYRASKPRQSILDLISEPEKSTKVLESVSRPEVGNGSYCEVLYSVDIALLIEAIDYGNTFADLDFSSADFKSLYYDMLDACDNDGMLDEQEYEMLEQKYEFLGR
jgi:hypothetical protein